VAWRILGEDVSQIDYYTERVKRIVCKVRTFNGITRYERGTYDLVGGEELSDAERDQLLELCANALTLSECCAARRGAVYLRRSLRLWAQEPPPHPDQRLVKHRVLTRAHAAPG